MKKTSKLFILICIIALIGTLLAFSAFAQESLSDDVTVILEGSVNLQYSKCTWCLTSDGTLTFISNAEKGWNEVPYYHQVVENGWLDYAKQIKRVVIGEGLMKIGANAFVNCINLETVEMSNVSQLANDVFVNCPNLNTIYIAGNEPVMGVFDLSNIHSVNGSNHFKGCGMTEVILSSKMTEIPYSFFRNCTKLKTVTIPDGVTEIGKYAFAECTSLGNIEIPDSVTNISDNAFSSCSSLTAVNIPDSVTNIGMNSFSRCTALTSVTIGSSVISIGDFAFDFCESLVSVIIPDSVNSIGKYAFEKCSSLTNLVIGNNLTTIERYAFFSCANLIDVVIPGSVSIIGDSAFRMCNSLTNVTIENGVTDIGYAAFRNCESLTTIIIPNSVNSIGNGAFSSCNSLTAIEVDENNSYYCDINGVLFSKDKQTLIAYPCGGSEIYSIPDGVTIISDYAFSNCSELREVNISKGVSHIGNYSFFACRGLVNVNIPESVNSIGESAFYRCESLDTVTFLTRNAVIFYYAFDNCLNFETIYLYRNSTADSYFSDTEYTKIYLDDSTEHEHEAEDEWYKDDAKHWQYCYCDSRMNEGVHADTDGDKVCDSCGYIMGSISGGSVEIGSATASRGNTVSVDITLSDTTGLSGLLMKLDFDRSALILKEIIYNNISYEVRDNIGEESSDDHISILLYDEDESIINGRIATLVFEVTENAAAGEHIIDLYYVEAVNKDQVEVDLTEKDGKITVRASIAGDVNFDGVVNVKDTVLLAQYLAGWGVTVDEKAADCNGDGEISVKDIVILSQYLADWDVTLG